MKEFKDARDDYDELEKWTNDFVTFFEENGYIGLTDVYEQDMCITFEIWENDFSKKYYEFNWFDEGYCINDLTNNLLISKLYEKMGKE